MTHLYLIRHGRSTWNAARRVQGHADPPLDEVGREQARLLAERLRENPPTALYTSPLQRAMETAEIIGDVLGLPATPDERLKEYDVGDLTGLTWEQVEERFPAVASHWSKGQPHTVPGAEERKAFRERVATACEEIVARHPEETVAVVSHGGSLGTYLNHLIKLESQFSPFRFGNCSLSIVETDPIRPRILLLNDTCHLKGAT